MGSLTGKNERGKEKERSVYAMLAGMSVSCKKTSKATATRRPNATDPDAKQPHGFPFKDYRTANIHFTNHDADTAKVVSVPLSKLVATQRFVRTERIESGLRGDRDPNIGKELPAWLIAAGAKPGRAKPPLVIVVDGVYYIQDGHHRLEIARLKGQRTARVRLLVKS